MATWPGTARCRARYLPLDISWLLQVAAQGASLHLAGLGQCGHYTTYTCYPDMEADLWPALTAALQGEASKVTQGDRFARHCTGTASLQVTRLRLSMMDSVSLSRGLGTVAGLVAGLAWVTLADLCLDSEQWRLVAGVLSSQPR